MGKIKIELTEPQYFLLLDAIHDHAMSLDDIAASDYPQWRNINMLTRIKIKLKRAYQGGNV